MAPKRAGIRVKLAKRLIRSNHVGSARDVLAEYASRNNLDQTAEALDQLAGRPPEEVRPMLAMLLESMGRERNRAESAAVRVSTQLLQVTDIAAGEIAATPAVPDSAAPPPAPPPAEPKPAPPEPAEPAEPDELPRGRKSGLLDGQLLNLDDFDTEEPEEPATDAGFIQTGSFDIPEDAMPSAPIDEPPPAEAEVVEEPPPPAPERLVTASQADELFSALADEEAPDAEAEPDEPAGALETGLETDEAARVGEVSHDLPTLEEEPESADEHAPVRPEPPERISQEAERQAARERLSAAAGGRRLTGAIGVAPEPKPDRSKLYLAVGGAAIAVGAIVGVLTLGNVDTGTGDDVDVTFVEPDLPDPPAPAPAELADVAAESTASDTSAPVPADTATVGAAAADTAAGATVVDAIPEVADTTPANPDAPGPNPIIVNGLDVSEMSPSQYLGRSGYTVMQLLDSGAPFKIDSYLIGDDSSGVPRVGFINVVPTETDTLVGVVQFEGYVIYASAPLPEDSLRALLGQLTQTAPPGPR